MLSRNMFKQIFREQLYCVSRADDLEFEECFHGPTFSTKKKIEIYCNRHCRNCSSNTGNRSSRSLGSRRSLTSSSRGSSRGSRNSIQSRFLLVWWYLIDDWLWQNLVFSCVKICTVEKNFKIGSRVQERDKFLKLQCSLYFKLYFGMAHSTIATRCSMFA